MLTVFAARSGDDCQQVDVQSETGDGIATARASAGERIFADFSTILDLIRTDKECENDEEIEICVHRAP